MTFVLLRSLLTLIVVMNVAVADEALKEFGKVHKNDPIVGTLEEALQSKGNHDTPEAKHCHCHKEQSDAGQVTSSQPPPAQDHTQTNSSQPPPAQETQPPPASDQKRAQHTDHGSKDEGGSKGGTSGGGGGGGDGKVPTFDQFKKAVAAYSKTTAGGNPPEPSQELYDAYVNSVGKELSLAEQAQFCANTIWESVGFSVNKEMDPNCQAGGCPYGKYFGRGFIQLSWDYNYKAASQAIFGDENVLISDPDKVLSDELSWKTALWFWTDKVHPKVEAAKAADQLQLGHSVMVINGGLECGPSANGKAANRLAIYKEIVKEWGLGDPEKASLTGCQ